MIPILHLNGYKIAGPTVLPGGVGRVLAVAHFLHGGDEDAGLESDDAAEAPFRGSQLADVGFRESGGVLELLEETVEQGVKFGGVFLGKDGVAGAEPVAAGVGGDFGFALGGFWAGRELGVAAIGFDFQLG